MYIAALESPVAGWTYMYDQPDGKRVYWRTDPPPFGDARVIMQIIVQKRDAIRPDCGIDITSFCYDPAWYATPIGRMRPYLTVRVYAVRVE